MFHMSVGYQRKGGRKKGSSINNVLINLYCNFGTHPKADVL